MAEYPESGLDSILQQRLGIADRKAEVLAEASQSKKNLFNPINAGNLEHVDGDTWRLKDSNRTFRAGTGDPSTTIDTFESKIERYEENPDRFRSHRRNYAKLTGKPEFLITKQELVDRGQAQAFKTAQRMEQAATEGRLAFRTTSVDDYGREVAELIDTQTGANFFSSGAEENASYDSKFNAGQRVKDIFGGVTGERDAFSGGRSAGTAALDQGGNLLSGALNMGNDLLHATSILTGARNQNSDQFFENNRGRIDRVKKYMVSEEQLSREARDGRNAARNEELYDARVNRYMKEDGATERSAKIKAGIQEFGDSVFDLIRNPGRVLDATVESLPYMIGVGFAGKAAVTASTNLIRNSVTKNAIKAGATAEQGAASAARYLSSKSGSRLLKTVATATGVGVVGLTEGLSTSAGVYSSIMGMTEEEAMQSERYQALRLDKGKNHKEALQELAEEAFDNTFITATAVAAGASLLTGAGAFESQLFTRLAGIRKEATGSATKAVAKEGTQRGLVGTAIAGTFKNTGKYAKFVGPAGLKEAAEETIQSGGGEFLSQLAKFEQGLGPEPGAGIGAAAGEGAVVGFASGAGAQTLSGGVKKLANAEVRKSGLDVIQRRKDIKNIVDNSGAPGGSAVTAVDTVTTPEQAAETLKAVEVIQAKGDEKSLAQTVQQFSTIQAAVDKIGEENLNESQKKSYEQARGDYVRNLDKLATDILSRERKTETYTKSESQILQAAMKADAPSVQNLKPDSDMGRAYNHTRRAVEVIKSAQTEAIDNAAIAQESEPNLSSAEAIRVANEKMGAGKSKQGYLGLQGHFNVISEAIAQKDKAAVAERSQRLANFINTQAQKLAKVKKVLDDPAHATQYGIEYKAGATEKYYNVLRSEMEKMVATRDELAGLAGQWMAGDTSVAKVTQVPRKVEVIKSAAAAAATQTQETQEEQETEESENPAPPSRKVAVERAESKGKVVEAKRGKTDDQKSEQAERTDDKSSGADSAAGTDTTADSEADNESSNDTTSAEGTPETSDTQSESSESSDTESTAANVTREQLEKMPSRAVYNMALKAGMKISGAANVGEMIDYILDQQTTEKTETTESNVVDLTAGKVRTQIRDLVKKVAELTDDELIALREVLVDEYGTDPAGTKLLAAVDAQIDERGKQDEELEQPSDFPLRLRSALYDLNDVDVALHLIATQSTNGLFREIGARLIEALKGRNITVETLSDKDFVKRVAPNLKNATAAFLPGDQAVILRISSKNKPHLEQAFLHELIHAALNNWMVRPKTTAEDKQLHNRANNVRNAVLKYLDKKRSEDPNNPEWEAAHRRLAEHKEEFITYAWTNPQIQEILKKIPYSGGTLFSRFVSTVAEILGVSGNTALREILQVGDEIVNRNRGEQGRTAKQGEVYIPEVLPTEGEIQAAEAEARAQAEAEPERSAGAEAEGPSAEKLARNNIYWDVLAEVKRLQTWLAEGKITEEQVGFVDAKFNKWYGTRLQGNTAAGALAQMETSINEALDHSIPRTPISTEGLNLDAALAAAASLAKTGSTEAPAIEPEQAGFESFDTEASWPRLKRWLLGSPPAAVIKTKVAAAFKKLGLPVSIASGFTQASKTAKSLITAVPNLHEILANPLARRALYDTLELKPDEEIAFEAFRSFRSEFAQAASKAYQSLIDNKFAEDRLTDNPAYLLTDLSDTMDPQALTAMAYESMNWLVSDGQSLFNDDDAIRDILGLDDNASPTINQRKLQTAGTLRRNIVDSLGQSAWKHLNLSAKQSADISPNLQERMESALGTIMIRSLMITQPSSQRDAGRIEAVSFDGSLFESMKGDGVTVHEDYSKPVNFIRIKPYGDRGSDRFYQTDANADLQDAVRPGRTVFQRVFGVSSMVKEPLLTVPTDENIPKRALRSLTKLSKKMTAAFKYQQEIPWETDNQMIDVLKRFNKEDFLAFSHEYNPDLGSVHSTELESVEGRNRTLETAFDNALKWARDNGDKDFYMTYAMTRTGRVNIASTFINPQASKIHRFLFRQKAWTETVEAGDTRMIENFKIAVGLGMGIKVDKLTREDALAAIDALMNSDLVTDALEQIATEGDINLQGEGNALAELLGEEGTHTLAALVAWQTHLDAHGGTFTVSLPMEVDGVTNGFAAGLLQTPPTDPEAIERLKGLLRATGVLFTDDTVNSFPQWLKDANNQDNYQTAAKKMALAIRDMFPGGSLAPDPKSREPGDLAAMVISENMDVILNSGFGPTEQDLRDPKVGRDFAKNPLMIVAYGASSRTVAANLVEKIMQDVYTQLAATNKMTINIGETETEFRERHAEAMLKVMNSAVDVMNVGQESFFARMGWSSNNRLKRYYDKEDLGRMIKRKQFESLDDLAQNFEFEGEHDIRNFETAMKATYGRSIEVALSDMLRGIKEIRNTYTQTITLMNAIFKVEFERRTDIERRSTGRVVGRRRRREILEQMMKEGLVPSIATAYSKSLEENLELTAYEHKTLENEKIKIHFPKNTGVTRRHFDKDGQLNLKEDTSSMTSTLTTRTPSTDVGVAGIVGTIHSLDGTNSADIFGSYDVLNMFDAWLMRLSDMDTVPLKGNDRFFNQHAEYDMGQELNKSLERMMALMATGEGRLSSNAQAEVGKLFVAELKAHNGWGPELQENFVLGQDADGNDIIDYDGVIKYFAFSMASTVQNVTAAKAELFKQIARVNQFSHDENSYEVSDKERSRPLPTIEQAEEYGRDKAATEKITAKAQTLARNLEADGNFSDAFFNWIQEEIPRPQEVLRTLTTLIGLVNGPGGSGESLQQLARVLHNYLDNSNPIIVGTLPKGFLGQYQNGQIIIDKSQFTEANNPIETLLHEIVHAATDSALTEIEESNPELLLELVAEARKFQARLAAKKTLSPGEQTVLQALKTQKDHVILVGEYMAYTQTTLSDEPGNLGLLFGTNVGLVDAFTAVGRVVSRGNSQNLRLRSSQDKVNNKLFDTVEEQKLEAEKLWDNFEAMRELDSNTEVAPTGRYREHIQALMEEVLIPGLSSLGRDTYLQLAVETDGTKNIGDFVERGSDKNTLRVQAAGAKLTNNGDMSNQEVFAHELTHAVTGYALARDTKVRAEMRKIFDSVKDRITWEDFMPPANEIAGSQAAVEAAAKARYNYIFGIGQDKSHDALQEFATIGLTNEAFALALTKLDSPSATTPIWDGNILSSILNLINRGLELLRSETLGTRKALNAHDAIFKLAQRIVTINQQGQARKYDKDGHKALWRNASDTKTGELVTKALDVLQEKLRATDDATRQKGGFTGLIRAGTHAALASRTEGQQQVWNKFQRHLGVNKSGDLAQAISEVLPYNKDDRGGVDGKMGFIDLLRHSKVNIDIARQRAIEHSRRVLLEAFDPKRRMQRAERIAMTNVLLKTDLVSLMEHNENRTLHDLQQMLGNEQLVDAEINRLMRELNSEMAQQKLPPALMTMYERQMNSLANYMIHSQMTEVNGMKNTHNIVNQFNLLDAADRIQVRDAEKLTALVDQLISLKALKLVERRDVDNALKVINHEMEREEDNGFLYTMGMYSNFKKSSAKDLFNNNPTQMRKGYVYEITNGDVNVEVIIDSAEERQRMHDLGMSEIGIVERDPRDKSTGSRRVLYKGYRGANTWQKSTVSLTDIHRQGQNLFAVSGYDPKATAFALGRMKVTANQEALKQFKQGAIDPRDTIAIPIVDDHGVIVDYTYEMSTANKQQHLKNTQHNDYFDQVLPRMFGSITDRVESSKTNDQVAGLLRKEYEAFKDSDEHNFVFVGKSATNPRAKEMWALLPDGMKRELNRQFRGTEFKDGFPIRDEAVNLVLGFRKLSILDIPGGNGKKLIRGKNATFAARTAERIWQELMQLVRIKMAIINPQVVAGNLSSNFGILLAEGIPVKYITSKTSEAIRSMRQYQRDIRRIDELQRHIGVFEASRRPTEKLVAERERLKAEIRKNPVGNLVQEGLFTSIVEDMSSDEDTYREWLVGSLLDKLKGPLPAKAVSLAKEAYMVPGSTAFNMAIAATQYGDFIGRYIKYKYDTEVKKVDKHDAIHRALASFIYYDMPQNRWLQLMNDNGFMMFSKFFLRIQPVVARLFQENPLKATGVLAAQAALMSPLDENIGTFALFQGAGNRFEPLPFRHLAKLDPTDPSLFQWFWPLGL